MLLIGAVIFLMPFLFILPLVRKMTRLMTIEEKIQLPSSVSMLNSVNTNFEIINQYLTEKHISKEIILDICNLFKSVQLFVVLYFIGGILQVFSIILYGIWVVKNFDFYNFLNDNSGQFTAYFVLLIFSCITFWIFYGKNFFEYLGFHRVEKYIDFAVSALFVICDKLSRMFVISVLSFAYFLILLIYFYFLIPIVQSIAGNSFEILLIGVCILIFIFYYGVPYLVCFVYKIFISKFYGNIDRNVLYETLKNDTYLYLLFIYFWGILIRNSDSVLLSGITVLFLFDTYVQNRIRIVQQKK